MGQLLDREEALAIQRISETLQNAGEGLCRATDLRARIQRHPYLYAGLGACLGFVGGPFVGRTLARVLPGLTLAALRGVRARL